MDHTGLVNLTFCYSSEGQLEGTGSVRKENRSPQKHGRSVTVLMSG
jgi:hypothetical protein